MANTMLGNSWVDEDLAGHSKLGYIVDFFHRKIMGKPTRKLQSKHKKTMMRTPKTKPWQAYTMWAIIAGRNDGEEMIAHKYERLLLKKTEITYGVLLKNTVWTAEPNATGIVLLFRG